jgi:hypothetical protein
MQQNEKLKGHFLAQQRVHLRLLRRQELLVVVQSAADVVAGRGHVAAAAAVRVTLPMLLPHQLQLLLRMAR